MKLNLLSKGHGACNSQIIQNKHSSKQLNPSPPKSQSAPKTPWERLKNSHLIVDRKTGDSFSLNSQQAQKMGKAPGEWIPMPKAQADEPTVEYLKPLKRFKISALKIGPIAAKEPVDLSVSLDENDENGRFLVIF